MEFVFKVQQMENRYAIEDSIKSGAFLKRLIHYSIVHADNIISMHIGEYVSVEFKTNRLNSIDDIVHYRVK